MTKIAPTVGRSLYYFPDRTESVRNEAGKPLLCLLCGVLSERYINVALFDINGVNVGGRQSVYLVQADEDKPNHSFAAWMPFQQEQAKAQVNQAGAPLTEQQVPSLDQVSGTSQPPPFVDKDGDGHPDNIVERGFDALTNLASRALGLATGLRAARDAGRVIKAGTGEIKGNDLDKTIAVLDAIQQVVPPKDNVEKAP